MEPVRWTGKTLQLLDQTRLPLQEEYVECCHYEDVARAIRTMVVRGAPAIGAAAAFGVVLAAQAAAAAGREVKEEVAKAVEVLAATRPTAVNLFWALNRMKRKAKEVAHLPAVEAVQLLAAEAEAILQEDLANNRAMGRYGAELVPDKAGILTHCNAGALATAGYGTALGVIRAAKEMGKDIHVFADETRPLLQGARLTAWELQREGIPVTLITDNMAAFVMQKGWVDLVLVGADRIAANGDTANKIGTYGLAVLARHHGIPFYVAAPFSTFDLTLKSGAEIPIEERSPEEVTAFGGRPVAPPGVKVFNPAFDVTPAELITAIITERGVIYPPFTENIAQMMGN